MKVLFSQMLLNFGKSVVFGRFPGFDLLSYWQQQRIQVDDYERGKDVLVKGTCRSASLSTTI